MVKIRLMRIGAKKRPFYRVVAVDERSKRTGANLEILGTYNPLTHPHEIKLNQERIDVWIKNGAQMSEGFLRIIGKAPQRPPRKPKKAPKETPAAAPIDQPVSPDPIGVSESVERTGSKENVIPSEAEGSSTSENTTSSEDSSSQTPQNDENNENAEAAEPAKEPKTE